ncbi:hypothetical protein LMH87_011063 [Akanthomyces muscarius]|uniref:Uncharacterized protein n=1 Tax=Akanthomyces muscarius TaxID=2231603 RepID=A0A9W8Q985_AKAMU|nr:hypothetical protein LMH87_011063 [Akanthomyces muscarius]KAJ4150309.1 hypothetical protein LMH87_011063 [Akanthomyces muscarius]
MHSGKLIYELRCMQGSVVEILQVLGIDSVIKGRVLSASPSPSLCHHNFCQIGAFICSHVPQASSTAVPV